MQQLRYAAPTVPSPPLSPLPKGAGCNWNDPAHQSEHKRHNVLTDMTTAAETRARMGYPSPPPPDVQFASTAALHAALEGKSEFATSTWLSLDDKVCRFFAYYTEPKVEGSLHEHVRKVEIHFYPVDNTVMISEPRINNSGLLGGTVLKRHRVPLSLETRRQKAATKLAQSGDLHVTRIASEELSQEKLLGLNELMVGEDVLIYGRTYSIVDCDPATREFLEGLGMYVAAPSPYPEDPYYTEVRTGLERTNSRRRMNSEDRDLKMSIDQLAKGFTTMHYPEAIARFRRFLTDDKTVLMFRAVWEDRDMPHGDLRTFEIRYFLWDDTVEVIERHKPNSGRDVTRAFAMRRRMPKGKDAQACDLTFSRPNVGALDPSMYYYPEDFAIGSYINVYGRALRLVDCDAFTRDFYHRHIGIELGPAIDVDREYGLLPPEPAPLYPPPHNKFGTEEDSLGNWRNLVLKAPKADITKWMELDGLSLKFLARFAKPTSAEEALRRFSVTFYLGDDTIQVNEIPGRNTGVTGGRFLRRQPMKKFEGEGRACNYTWHDFCVGATPNLMGHLFELLETDEPTRRIRYHRSRLPPGIDEATVDHYLRQWGFGPVAECGAVPLGQVIAQCAAADELGRVLVELMGKYNADYGYCVTVKDFVQTITADPVKSLADAAPDGSESPGLLAAKLERRRVILAHSAALKIQQELDRRGLKPSDAFRIIATFPASKKDIAGSNNSNNLHLTFNAYQLLSACKEFFKVEFAEDEVDSMVQEFFPAPQKSMALAAFVDWMAKADSFGGFAPLRSK